MWGGVALRPRAQPPLTLSGGGGEDKEDDEEEDKERAFFYRLFFSLTTCQLDFSGEQFQRIIIKI